MRPAMATDGGASGHLSMIGLVCDCCSMISSMNEVVKTTFVVQWGMGMKVVYWQSMRIWCLCSSGECKGSGGWSWGRVILYLFIKLAITTFSLRCASGLIMWFLTSRWFVCTVGRAVLVNASLGCLDYLVADFVVVVRYSSSRRCVRTQAWQVFRRGRCRACN